MHAYENERQLLADRIYNINEEDFTRVAIDVWKYQYRYNSIYQAYCDLLSIKADQIHHLEQIPFLPIIMFREHAIKTGSWSAKTIFKSSGTTGSLQSKHHIRDIDWYHQIAEMGFAHAFADPSDYTWLCLLPTYLERPDSSLIDMVNHFMHVKKNPDNQFFPAPGMDLIQALNKLQSANKKTILLGVSFALLDLFENFDVPIWKNLLVMDTGGTKGRRKEITKEELFNQVRIRHQEVCLASEYGMTELLSQAYRKNQLFEPSPTIKIFTRDISDPLSLISTEQRGAVNVIDLGNLDTCSFIATDDIGITYADGSFDVLGRMDQSDLRGCNLMYV